MARSDYIEPKDLNFGAQLATFKANIGGYATTFGLTPAQVTAQAADADYYAYTLDAQRIIQNSAAQWTGWKTLLRAGGAPPGTGTPVAPALATAPTAVPPGVEPRFRALAQHIKAGAAYNPTIGHDLGIEGTVSAPVDLTTLRPDLAVRPNGGEVFVAWGWQGHHADLDLIELQVDRGDGKGFVLLAYDTTPGYNDTTPLPAAPAKWTYKAIYRVADARVGQWSNEISLTVGG